MRILQDSGSQGDETLQDLKSHADGNTHFDHYFVQSHDRI